ncbi:MAG: HAD family hydrolase [Treponema sp.]|nr:HAD family hydrolase [Treponema sp.]
MSSRFGAVAFDLDGTLYPNSRFYLRMIPFVAGNLRFLLAFSRARHIIRKEQERFPERVVGDFYGYQAGLVAGLLGIPERAGAMKEKIDALVYRGWEPIFAGIRLFPHVRELLGEFRAAGLKLALLSDFPPRAKLENMALAGLWDAVLCSEEIGALKPSVHSFKVMADDLDLPPEKILYVGNSRRYDVAGARAAGMATALIAGRNGNPRADLIFKDYRQLKAFVLK